MEQVKLLITSATLHHKVQIPGSTTEHHERCLRLSAQTLHYSPSTIVGAAVACFSLDFLQVRDKEST
eukprot:5047457-Amphidinium_carterae.1